MDGPSSSERAAGNKLLLTLRLADSLLPLSPQHRVKGDNLAFQAPSAACGPARHEDDFFPARPGLLYQELKIPRHP